MTIYIENKLYKMVKIKDFEDYFITEDGDVISFKKYGNKSWRKLKPRIQKNGYVFVILSKNGKHFKKIIHRLVSLAFLPNPENKPQVNHIDGNKLNNHYTNLEWITASENILHAWNNGLKICSEKTKQKMSNSHKGIKREKYKSYKK